MFKNSFWVEEDEEYFLIDHVPEIKMETAQDFCREQKKAVAKFKKDNFGSILAAVSKVREGYLWAVYWNELFFGEEKVLVDAINKCEYHQQLIKGKRKAKEEKEKSGFPKVKL